jgi:hypothetical protein
VGTLTEAARYRIEGAKFHSFLLTTMNRKHSTFHASVTAEEQKNLLLLEGI